MAELNSDDSKPKLYYPYSLLVKALDIQDYEVDFYGRPTCLMGINHDFFFVAKLFYLELCELDGYVQKLAPLLKQKTSSMNVLLTLIEYARTEGFTTERIIEMLSCRYVEPEEIFRDCDLEEGKFYILEYGVHTSHPELCAWKHPHLPVGSLLPNMPTSLQDLTGETPQRALEILEAISNLKPGTRYFDIITMKYKNGTDHAVQYVQGQRLLSTKPVRSLRFFASTLKYKSTRKIFHDWLQMLVSDIPVKQEERSVAPPLQFDFIPKAEPVSQAVEIKAVITPQNTEVKKTQPPKDIRNRIWRRHFNTFEGNCWCCGKKIEYELWHCAHILAEANGGTRSLENMVPCCVGCNQGMGTMHMYDYMKMYYPDRLTTIGWSKGSYPVQ